MERVLAVIEATALALWIGALAGFAFVFAPATLAVLANPDAFGPIALATLERLDTFGFWCGCIALVAILLRSRDDAMLGRGTAVRALAVVMMILFVVVEAQVIVPAVHGAVAALGAPLTSLQGADPRRISYDRLHGVSTAVYAALLLLGLVALGLSVLSRPESIRRRLLR